MCDSEISAADTITELPGHFIAAVSKKSRYYTSAIFGLVNGITELDSKITGSR